MNDENTMQQQWTIAVAEKESSQFLNEFKFVILLYY